MHAYVKGCLHGSILLYMYLHLLTLMILGCLTLRRLTLCVCAHARVYMCRMYIFVCDHYRNTSHSIGLYVNLHSSSRQLTRGP